MKWISITSWHHRPNTNLIRKKNCQIYGRPFKKQFEGYNARNLHSLTNREFSDWSLPATAIVVSRKLDWSRENPFPFDVHRFLLHNVSRKAILYRCDITLYKIGLIVLENKNNGQCNVILKRFSWKSLFVRNFFLWNCKMSWAFIESIWISTKFGDLFPKASPKVLNKLLWQYKNWKKEKTHDKGKHNSIDGKLLNFLIEFPSVKKAFLL